MDFHYDAELSGARHYVYILPPCLLGTEDTEEDGTVEAILNDASASKTFFSFHSPFVKALALVFFSEMPFFPSVYKFSIITFYR